MKRHIFFLSLLYSAFALDAVAEENPDKIIGVWKSDADGLMVKIDKVGDHFQGRIVWIESGDDQGLVCDEKNPDKRLASMPLKGNKIIQELNFNAAESIWDGGTFYSYKEGKRYRCRIKLSNENQISIQKILKGNQATASEIWIRQ
ncbi:MAG: DUF2147 domain-containing protein [Cyclobacteriaceae bacterium]|nr:DUF2147 domain-containing protein [Cyclobacteriaceae bacterium]